MDVQLHAPKDRLRHALESIEKWLQKNKNLNIVLCDGSGYDLTEVVKRRFPKAEIECLHFLNDVDLIKKYGRGYGEGEIIKYAILNSRHINAYGAFVKCSSKLWVENFNECLNIWESGLAFNGIFLNALTPMKETVFHHIDTRFYIADCESYKKKLWNAHHKIRKSEGFGLEECFREVLLKESPRGFLLTVTPIISGVGGGTGKYYKTSWMRIIKDKVRLHLTRKDKKFKKLFI